MPRPKLSSALLSLLPPMLPAQDPAMTAWLDTQLPALEQLYRHLHQHPELSFHEVQTQARLASEFEAAGAVVTRGVGGGIVGVLQNGEGPLLLQRTDMDALPVAEQTGLPYASQVRARSADGGDIGIMHACGHDLHMTNLVGVLRWCHEHREAWAGTLLAVGQPAEEVAGGAKAMLAVGCEPMPRR